MYNGHYLDKIIVCKPNAPLSEVVEDGCKDLQVIS